MANHMLVTLAAVYMGYWPAYEIDVFSVCISSPILLCFGFSYSQWRTQEFFYNWAQFFIW